MKVYWRTIIFFLLYCLGQDAWSSVVQIKSIRSSISPDKFRLVLDLSSPLKYNTTVSSEKIVVDVKGAKLIAALDKISLAKTPVRSIASKKNGNDLSLILNLKKPVKLKDFLLTKPHRLVLDLYYDGKAKDVVVKPVKTSSKPKKLRKIVVVIDPGHGGKDPGAIGRGGTREKHINLAVAKKLQRIINNTKGFRAYLTRSKDIYVPLRKRLSVAHNRKADMFISIHADAYKNKKARGASVFALSQRGATSEAARWLAQKENESELGQVISDKSQLLRSVLIDLAQTATISASLEMGGKILNSLSRTTSLHSKKVEQAAFVVLKSPDVPSLLVEVGFLSHAREERKLRGARHQDAIAKRLAAGIKSYFLRRPPADTYLAINKNNIRGKRST